MMELVNRLLKRREIRKTMRAAGVNFPVSLTGVYCYGATREVDKAQKLAWVESCIEKGLENEKLWPLRCENNKMGVYKLLRHYQDGYRGMDYACGDSGHDGDFELIRVDDVPLVDLNEHIPMECDHNSCCFFVPLRYFSVQIGGCGKAGGFCDSGPHIHEYMQQEKKEDIEKIKAKENEK